MVEGQGSGGCRWRPVVNVSRFSVSTAGIEGYSIGWICDEQRNWGHACIGGVMEVQRYALSRIGRDKCLDMLDLVDRRQAPR